METKTVWLVMYQTGYHDGWDVIEVCATEEIAVQLEAKLSKKDPMTSFGVFEYDLRSS